MGVSDTITSTVRAFGSKDDGADFSGDGINVYPLELLDEDASMEQQPTIALEVAGVTEVEGMQRVWGKHGKYLLWAG